MSNDIVDMLRDLVGKHGAEVDVIVERAAACIESATEEIITLRADLIALRKEVVR